MNSDSSICSEATADLIAAAMDLAKKKAIEKAEVRKKERRNARERKSTEGSVATPKTKRNGGNANKKKTSAAKPRQTKLSSPRKSVTSQKKAQSLPKTHGSSVSNRDESEEGDSDGTETERSTQSCCSSSSSSLGELTDVSDDPMHLLPNSEPPSTNQILLEVARMYRQHAHLYLRQVAILEQTSRNRPEAACSTTEETENIVEMVKTMHEAVGEFQKLVKCVVEHGGGGDTHAAVENEETKKANGTDHQRRKRRRKEERRRRQKQEWHAENDPWRAFERDAVLQICEEDEFLRLHEQRTMTNDGVQKVQNYVKRRTLEMWGDMSMEEKEAYLEYTWGAGIDNGCDDRSSNCSVNSIHDRDSYSKRKAKK